MLPIVNHIVYTFIILIACAYILHENTEDATTKKLIYKGITLGVMILIFFIGAWISKVFDNMNGTVIYVGSIIFIGITSYLTFVNKTLLTGTLLTLMMVTATFLAGIMIGKMFRLNDMSEEAHIINVLGSHYSYILIICVILTAYVLYMYYKNKNEDPNYKCNLKTLCVSSSVALIIIFINFIIYNSHDIKHKIELKYE